MSDPVVRELLEEVQSIPDMAEFLNTVEGHRKEFGGAGGIASARSVAKIYAATIGEIDSVRLLAPTTLDVVTQPRTLDLGPVPQLAGVPNQKIAEFGLGFWYTCTGMWLDTSRPDPRVGWADPLADIAGA